MARHETSRIVRSVPVLLCLFGCTGGARAANPEFNLWLEGMRMEARTQGIREGTLDLAFAGLEPIPRVIELDRRQPEVTLTFPEYLARVVTEERIREGREKLRENRALLEEIGRAYGVPPRFIVALWGIETDYGRRSGDFPVVAALATLAFDGRRSSYFRRELIDALFILDEGHVDANRMKGSWAGAMGQNQFMPSSFRHFARDHDGDGRRDIWTTKADVFASAANFLASSGWRKGETWGRRVKLPPDFDPALAGLDVRKKLAEWQALGVRREYGKHLPTNDMEASIVLPSGPAGPAYAVYDNYRAILQWNRSIYFATTVGYLADRIGGE